MLLYRRAPQHPAELPPKSSAAMRLMRTRLSLLFVESRVAQAAAPAGAHDVSEWLLRPTESDASAVRIACMQQDLLTPQTLFELVVFNGRVLEPGWLFQTTAQWLLLFFPTHELVALPIFELRKRILEQPARIESCTVLRAPHFSWHCVEDADYLVWKMRSSRVLSLHEELNEPLSDIQVLGLHKAVRESTAECLLSEMRRSVPGARYFVSSRKLKEIATQLNGLNRMRGIPEHSLMASSAPWKLPPQ